MNSKYTRKIYTARLLFHDLGFLLANIPNIRGAQKNKKLGKAFMEKVMTVVTAVNGCRYCEWFHAKQAASSGISDEEIKNLFKLQFHADASDFELQALLYAQHYAETNRKPDQEMTDKLLEYYGHETTKHIMLMIRMIFFGNLSGNTFDAFLSRLQGVKAENSNLVFEFLFFLINAPVLLPFLILNKK